MQQARQLALRDPDASGMLLSQIATTPDVPVVSNAYRPVEIYAVLALECGWTPTQIDNEHYPRLFRLMREISRIKEEQQNQIHTNTASPTVNALPYI